MNAFFWFVLLSGLGWLCDFTTFMLLVGVFDVSTVTANFISSYVGVSFVWFTSLRAVFYCQDTGRGRFLFYYWCFQFISITAYSQLLHSIAVTLLAFNISIDINEASEMLAKVAITPFNLVTNFLFMKFLIRFMRQERIP